MWFIVQSWVWDSDRPVVLVSDTTDLRKMFTIQVVPNICKLVTWKVVGGLPLAFVWGSTLNKWVSMAQNHHSKIICNEEEWYLLWRSNPVRCHLVGIQITSALEYLVRFLLCNKLWW